MIGGKWSSDQLVEVGDNIDLRQEPNLLTIVLDFLARPFFDRVGQEIVHQITRSGSNFRVKHSLRSQVVADLAFYFSDLGG